MGDPGGTFDKLCEAIGPEGMNVLYLSAQRKILLFILLTLSTQILAREIFINQIFASDGRCDFYRRISMRRDLIYCINDLVYLLQS